MSAPFFSVVLPTNADHAYLDLAINSILDQSYRHFELLLVVNGPDHNLLAQRFKQRYANQDNVRVLDTPMCKLPFALNLGIHAAQGDYIVRMDSDDISAPHRLEALAACLTQNPEADVLGSNYQFIDQDGRFGAVSSLPQDDGSIRFRLPFKCVLAHPTLCLRRSLMLSVGGYMYGVASEDYDLWLRLLRHHSPVKFLNLPQVLLYYRIHESQATSTSRIGEFVAHDVALRVREFLMTTKPMFLLGILRSVVQYAYRKIAKR